MQGLGLKKQNYARSRPKNAILRKTYAENRKIMQDLRLKMQNYAISTLKKRKIMQDIGLKTQNYARSTLKSAKLCKI